jgi:hypothetical protein
VYGPGDTPQDVPTAAELLTVTTRCARAGVDSGFLYLTDGEKEMTDFQKAALEKTELRDRLRTYGGKPVEEFLDWVTSWNQTAK